MRKRRMSTNQKRLWLSARITTLFLLPICLAAACSTTKSRPPIAKEGIELKLTPVRFPNLDFSKAPAGPYVFRDEKQWREFCSKYGLAPAPPIVFRESSLIAEFLGQRPNPGYSVEIFEAREYQQGIVIKVKEYAPAPGMMYAQVITYPYSAALIPKTDKAVRFEKTLEVREPQRKEEPNRQDPNKTWEPDRE